MQHLYDRIIDLRAVTHKQWMAREQVKQSDAFRELDRQIADLTEKANAIRDEQAAMLNGIPDSKGALADAERELFEAMKLEGREVFGEAKMKYSNKSEVNKERLLDELHGDLTAFFRLSTVTQAALKQHVKESGEKRLLGCIETVSTPVGIEFPP